MKKVIDFGPLKIDIEVYGDISFYLFMGHIDEKFKEIEVPRASQTSVIFDLEHVKSVNSVGIREWINLINDFKGIKNLTYKKCSIPFVDQMNMVPDSIGEAKIQSFYAPYFRDCNRCNGEKECLLDMVDHKESLKKLDPPMITCDMCMQTLEFDALEESYFSFCSQN